MKRVALVLCALPFAATVAAAQAAPEAPAPVRLGLDEAVSRATLASPRLAAARGPREPRPQAQRRGAAAAERWPQVDVGGGLPVSLGGSAAHDLRPDRRSPATVRAAHRLPEHPGQLPAAGGPGTAGLHRRPRLRPDRGRRQGTRGGAAGPQGGAGRPGPGDQDRLLVPGDGAGRRARPAGSHQGLRGPPRGRAQPREVRHGGAQRGAGGRGGARPHGARSPAGHGRRRRGRGQPAPAARPAARHARGADGATRTRLPSSRAISSPW